MSERTHRRKKKKKKKWLWPVIIGLLIVSLLGAVAIKNKDRKKGTEVELEQVERRDLIEKVGASGRIFPEAEVKISSDVSGEIITLNVMEGDSVRKGQLLARIDPEVLASAVERGEASVKNQQALLAQSRSQIQNAEAQRDQINAQLENQMLAYNRSKSLYDQGVISKQELENAQAQVDQLNANLASATASIQASKDQAKAAEYSVSSAGASLKELRTNLNRTSIFSPTDGIVSQLNVEQGERVVGTIQMTGTELMRIANFASMEAQVEVSESDILDVALGQSVDIEVDAYLDETFKGVVTEIASSAANTVSGGSLTSDQVTYFIVKIRLDPKSYAHLTSKTDDHPFRPGMSTTVDIYTAEKKAVVTVPIQAVTTRDLDEDDIDEDIREVVFLAQADTAALQVVETGIQDDNYIEILSGLDTSHTIIKGPYSVVSRKLEDGDDIYEKEKKDDKKKRFGR